MSAILGLNAYHGDAAACIILDGRLMAAAEEERFRRIKHWAGYPSQAIEFCLQSTGLSISDIDVIAINTDPSRHRLKKICYALSGRLSIASIRERLRNAKARSSLRDMLENQFGCQVDAKIENVPHHIAHLASAFFPSAFDQAALVSVDGFGDFSSGCWGVGTGSDIKINSEILYPHSLGVFYQAITQYLGFPNFGDEYKVMGLAPYGEPKFIEKMREIVRVLPRGSYGLELDYFRFHREQIDYEWDAGSPVVGRLYSEKLCELLGPAREKDEELSQKYIDIAASGQRMFEDALFSLLSHVKEETGLSSLCLSGGCANNSVANGKIRKKIGFDKVYVPASAGDAGGAVGSALFVSAKYNEIKNGAMVKPHAYVGPCFSNNEIEACLTKMSSDLSVADFRITKMDFCDLYESVSSSLVEGKVVGWFQGKMEWGPRALGNRSILGDPRRSDMKDILNQKIKRRESFRPFAPSILREQVANWFEEDDDVPFMMKVLPIREEKRSIIPAVAHVDGSGRLQTVHAETNPEYYELIKSFFHKTGVPILLNTSFNENEPVVCKPEEALLCFLRTNMDVLAMGNYVIERINDDTNH